MNSEEYLASLSEIDAALGLQIEHSDNSQNFYQAIDEVDNALEHHGILGMKWGIRRYQNPDGSLTELGQKHYGSGKTQKVIDKFNQRKSIALAKGDTEFARKYMDYLSNDELQAFKSRIAARTSLDDLKQTSRKITAEKLQTWSQMVGSVSTFLANGVYAYNNVAKIVNSVSGKKVIPPLKDYEEPDDPNKWTSKVVRYDQDGKSITETYGKKQKGGG